MHCVRVARQPYASTMDFTCCSWTELVHSGTAPAGYQKNRRSPPGIRPRSQDRGYRRRGRPGHQPVPAPAIRPRSQDRGYAGPRADQSGRLADPAIRPRSQDRGYPHVVAELADPGVPAIRPRSQDRGYRRRGWSTRRRRWCRNKTMVAGPWICTSQTPVAGSTSTGRNKTTVAGPWISATKASPTRTPSRRNKTTVAGPWIFPTPPRQRARHRVAAIRPRSQDRGYSG